MTELKPSLLNDSDFSCLKVYKFLTSNITHKPPPFITHRLIYKTLSKFSSSISKLKSSGFQGFDNNFVVQVAHSQINWRAADVLWNHWECMKACIKESEAYYSYRCWWNAQPGSPQHNPELDRPLREGQTQRGKGLLSHLSLQFMQAKKSHE